MSNLIVLYIIIFLINIFWVFGFFVRLVGVETKKWSTTNSIFQIINLIPRTIGVLQIPLITLYTETAIINKESVQVLFYQGILVFNLFGILFGFLLIPLFFNLISNIIVNIYDKSSFKVVFKKDLWQSFGNFFVHLNYKKFYTGFSFFSCNKFYLFICNLGASYLLFVALPACVLAGYYVPVYRATIISSVSIIYGLSTFITILFIDTKISVITDKAFHGSLSILELKNTLFECFKGRIFGIILGIFSLPYIAKIIVIIVNFFLK
jgi:hypothetical protein